MPSKKYYRCCLPTCLLQMIGNYAGDGCYRLQFTYSTKRKFLSTIRLIPRRHDCGQEMVLTKKSWRPVKIGHHDLLERLRDELPISHCHVFRESLIIINRLLAQTHDYTINHKIDKYTWD